MLMTWIGSYGAKDMERLADQEIGCICGEVLRQIVPQSRQAAIIDNPTKVFASRWFSNRYVCGSYSNRSVEYEQLKLNAEYNVDILAKPIRVSDVLQSCDVAQEGVKVANENCPLVLFAGEATDRVHYSTTDGAFRSGVREAHCLTDYHEQFIKKK